MNWSHEIISLSGQNAEQHVFAEVRLATRMGAGRWSGWGRGSCEGHSLEFGFACRFDIRLSPSSVGLRPDFWWASAGSGSLGEFPSFEAAAQACEDEARRLIEPLIHVGVTANTILVADHWKLYLALPHRLRSRKTASRRR